MALTPPVARLVGMKQHKVHVIKERVGGGFGSKQDILLEEVCARATCVTGRPVLFRYTREEEFIANTSRHVAKVTVKLGAKRWSPDGSEDGFPRQHWPLRQPLTHRTV